MAETADDLSTPLGQKTARAKRRYRLPFTGTQALAVVLGLFLVAFAGFAIFNDNPLGGEPIAHIALRQAPRDLHAHPLEHVDVLAGAAQSTNDLHVV